MLSTSVVQAEKIWSFDQGTLCKQEESFSSGRHGQEKRFNGVV